MICIELLRNNEKRIVDNKKEAAWLLNGKKKKTKQKDRSEGLFFEMEPCCIAQAIHELVGSSNPLASASPLPGEYSHITMGLIQEKNY